MKYAGEISEKEKDTILISAPLLKTFDVNFFFLCKNGSYYCIS